MIFKTGDLVELDMDCRDNNPDDANQPKGFKLEWLWNLYRVEPGVIYEVRRGSGHNGRHSLIELTTIDEPIFARRFKLAERPYNPSQQADTEEDI